MIKNILEIVAENSIHEGKPAFEYLRRRACVVEQETGNQCVIERTLRYSDTYDRRERYFYNLSLIELIED